MRVAKARELKHDKLNFTDYALSFKNVHRTQTTLALNAFKTN